MKQSFITTAFKIATLVVAQGCMTRDIPVNSVEQSTCRRSVGTQYDTTIVGLMGIRKFSDTANIKHSTDMDCEKAKLAALMSTAITSSGEPDIVAQTFAWNTFMDGSEDLQGLFKSFLKDFYGMKWEDFDALYVKNLAKSKQDNAMQLCRDADTVNNGLPVCASIQAVPVVTDSNQRKEDVCIVVADKNNTTASGGLALKCPDAVIAPAALTP